MNRIVKKPEDRKAEIVQAATSYFLNKGYSKTTMYDIMDEVNIAKGTIYHYFKSKDDLMTQVVQEIGKKRVFHLEEVVSADKSAKENFAALLTAGDVSNEQKELLEQIHTEENREMHLRFFELTVVYVAPVYAKVIEQGNQEGVFHVKNPLETAELLLAGICFLVDEGFYHQTEEDIQRRQKAIPSLLEAQLKTEDGFFDFLKG